MSTKKGVIEGTRIQKGIQRMECKTYILDRKLFLIKRKSPSLPDTGKEKRTLEAQSMTSSSSEPQDLISILQ